MVELNTLAGKIFSLLKGNGLKIKIFNEDGAEITDPNLGRRFFVLEPNIMVTIDEDGSQIQFSKGANAGESINKLQKNIRKLADEFLMNTDIKVFGKQIQPRDFAYQAKMEQGNAMMENSIKPHNHHLVAQVMKLVKHFGGKISQSDLLNNLGTVDSSEIRPVLNKLVNDGKLTAEMDKGGQPVYAIAIDEAVMEASAHKKEVARKTAEYEKKLDKERLDREKKHGETFHYGTAKVVKDPADTVKESFSKMAGSLKTSHQTLENVRILVKHKAPVDENVRGARSRHISAIFLECNGERFRFPSNYLPGARAMAQHMAHGGQMADKVGAYITESVSNLGKLQSFNRYVTVNKLINEDSSGIIETVKENIEAIRLELKKLTGVKTYETVKARVETFEREALSEDDTSGLKDLFTIRRFDEKFEEVLPIVKQMVQEKDTYHKRIEEAASKTVSVRNMKMSTAPIFEFASENASIGFKLGELSLSILENDELAGFVGKVGTKLCKGANVNNFEKAVMAQVLENIQIKEIDQIPKATELVESVGLDTYFDRYTDNFMTYNRG